MTHVWIVEMLIKDKWLPTTAASYFNAAGKIKLNQWRNDNPNDKFRLKKYVRAT